MREFYRVAAEISLDNICENMRRIREITPKGGKIMAVVKADGYGHGAVPVAKALDPLVDAYGVAIVEEGAELRRAGVRKPILALGITPRQQMEELFAYDVMPSLCDYETARQLSEMAGRLGKTLRAHVKLDTGMSRIGFLPGRESVEEIVRMSKLPGLVLDGIFSHLATADCADKSFAREQLSVFREMVAELSRRGVDFPTAHIANSAAIMEMPEAHLDMVRSGISTYGLYPSDEVDKGRLPLRPAMSLVAYVSMVKELDAGVGVGYGRTFVTKRRTRVATIPVGYGDGYPRALSNQGRVILHGEYAPIIGRVCMDQFMVDVTDIDGVRAQDRAILVGEDGDKAITLEEIGAMSASFNYEAACDIGKRVPRVYVYGGKKVGTYDYFGAAGGAYDLDFSKSPGFLA